MYREFSIKVKDATLMGYLWPVEDPEKVVLIIHGIGEHGGLYNRMAQEFNKHNFAVAAIDLRGHGCTTGKRGHAAPRESVLHDVDALILFAREFYKEVPIVLLGHSMGGNISLDYRNRGVCNDELSAYVICSPWLRLVRKETTFLAKVLKPICKLLPNKQLSAGIKPKYRGNPEVIANHINKKLTHNSITLQTAEENINKGIEILSGNAKVSKNNGLNKPMLLMHGSSDHICDVDASRELAALEEGRCEYIEWDNYFHELHNGSADYDGIEVIETIAKWIEHLD